MKSILYTIAIIFTSTTIYSQDSESLKKIDTIYIKFKGIKNEKKHNIQTHITPNNFDEKAFVIKLKNDKGILQFDHVKYKNWEKKNADITSEIKKVNKLFLKKNKDKIISSKLLAQYNYQKIVCEILSRSKTLYIIDYTEKKERNITLYEVILINYCPVSE